MFYNHKSTTFSFDSKQKINVSGPDLYSIFAATVVGHVKVSLQ